MIQAMRWNLKSIQWVIGLIVWAFMGLGVGWADSRIGLEGLDSTNSPQSFKEVLNAADYLRVYQRQNYSGSIKAGETVHLPSRVVMGPLLPQEIPSSGWSVMLTAPMVIKGAIYGIWGDFKVDYAQIRSVFGYNNAAIGANMNGRSHVYQGVIKVDGTYPTNYITSGLGDLNPIIIELEKSVLTQKAVFQLVVVIEPSASASTPAIRIPISFAVRSYGNTANTEYITSHFRFMWPGQLSMPDWISTTGETTIVTLLFKPSNMDSPRYYVFGDVVSKLK